MKEVSMTSRQSAATSQLKKPKRSLVRRAENRGGGRPAVPGDNIVSQASKAIMTGGPMKIRNGCLRGAIGVMLTVIALDAPAAELNWVPRADVIGETFGRGLHASGVIGNVIYVAGGGFIGSSLWGSFQSTVAYDPITDTWSVRTPMPTLRAAPASAVATYMGQERLYVIGGVDLSDFPIWHFSHPDIEEYDPIADSWRTVGAGMPGGTHTWGSCAVVVDNLIYIMGGVPDYFGSASARIAAYNPDTDSYTNLTPMPSGVSDGTCAVFNGDIYYFGGYPSGQWGGAPSSLVYVYDIDGNSWQTLGTPMPLARASAAAIVIGYSVYIVGGWDGSGNYGGLYNSIDAYDPALDEWTLDVLNPLACVEDDGTYRGRAGLTLHRADDGVSDQVYAVGGNVGISLPTRCNESAPIVIDGLIFADSFESGNTLEWSSTQP
jgi:N-acetylneuraminic acid mutarotase